MTITTTTIIAGNHDTIMCEVYLSAEIVPDYSSLSVEWYHNGINVNSHTAAIIRGGNTKNSTKDICVNCKYVFKPHMFTQ